jgi:hypothetical protein
MNKKETIKKICLMPKTYKDRGDISMVDLFVEVGGHSALKILTEFDLSQALRNIPGVIDSWLQMSDDNRSIPAWYFRKVKDRTKWEVGYYPKGEIIYFDNPIEACANYIRHYLDQLIGNIR